MKAPILSIICPVYNVEQYLPACVDSVLGQTFADYELILVDDGSTDASGALCDQLAKEDERIRTIHKENGGQGTARNAGLEIARGDYITFIDSDDEYGTASTLEENIKIVLEDERIEILQYPRLQGGKLRAPEKDYIAMGAELSRLFFGYKITASVWDKLFKREVFKDIRFEAVVYEDTLFVCEALKICEYFFCGTHGFYNYKLREGSTMTQKESQRRCHDFIYVELKILEYGSDLEMSGEKILIIREIFEHMLYGEREYGREAFHKFEERVAELIPDVATMIRYGYRLRFICFPMLAIKLVGSDRFWRRWARR